MGRHRRAGSIARRTLAIAICTHNPRRDFLERTVASLRDQTLPLTEWELLIVDNASMQLVVRPETFDILLTSNLYGDILSDLAAGLVGGLGIVPGANMGEKYAVFEAVHGSAPDIAGKHMANPTALMQSAVLMLLHLRERKAADRLSAALQRVYEEGRALTVDVGGKASTTEFTDAVIEKLGAE